MVPLSTCSRTYRLPCSPCRDRARRPVRVWASDAAASNLPPGDVNVLKETFDIITNGDTFGTTRYGRYGSIYKTSLLGTPTIMVYDDVAVCDILAREGKGLEVTWPDATKSLVGPHSLNLLVGEEHDRIKQLLAAAFAPKQLPQYAEEVYALVRQMATDWQSAAASPLLLEECKLLAFASLSRCFLGFSTDRATLQRNVQLMDDLAAGFNSPTIALPGLPYSKALSARTQLLQQLDDVLDSCTSLNAQQDPATAPSSNTENSSLQLRREDGTSGSLLPGIVLAAKAMSAAFENDDSALLRSYVQDNAIAALFGNVSAGPTIVKVFQYVGSIHREKICAELQRMKVFENGSLNWAALSQCSYLEAVVNEVLRITPAVPVVFRRSTQDMDVGEYTVPEGFNVWPHLGDAVLRYNTDKFEPDRWLQTTQQTGPGNKASQGAAPKAGQCPFEFSAPFGAASRTCLGRSFMIMQLKVLTATLAWYHNWTVVPPEGGGSGPVQWTLVPTPRPKGNITLNICDRKSAA